MMEAHCSMGGYGQELMEVLELARLPVEDQSHVAEARYEVARQCRMLGYSPPDVGRASIVVTEIATNIVRHAVRGEILLREVRATGRSVVEFLALDRGPGIENLKQAMTDGFSSIGSQGIGLGSIGRLSSLLDIYSDPARGTALLAQVSPRNSPPLPSLRVSGVVTPIPGEPVSGDGWAARHIPFGLSVLAVDGLGHGAEAAESSREAVLAFSSAGLDARAGAVLEVIDGSLRHTRGAAGAVANIDLSRDLIQFAGIGNIRAAVFAGAEAKNLVSFHGILGHRQTRIREMSYPWRQGSVLVLASDGLDTHWDLREYPGLVSHHVSVIAGVLFRDHQRGTDDAAVVVVRPAMEAPGAAAGE